MSEGTIWRARGMPDLGALTVAGFSGYAVLLAVAPLWAIHGGSSEAGSGLVNGVLLGTTVLAQLGVPRLLRRIGTGPALAVGLTLLGLPGPAYLLSDGLGWILLLSAVRGVGFGILTVTGAALTAHLVEPGRRGAAIGAFGLAVAVPNLVLLPASVPLVDRWGFAPAFWLAALPLAGVPSALRLGRVLRAAGHGTEAPEGPHPDRRALLAIVPPTLVLFAVTMTGGAVITFAPQLAGTGTAAALLLMMGATAAFSRWLVGGIADRYGARQFLAPLLLSTAASTGLAAWAVAREQPVLLVLAVTVLGLSYGALQNLTLVVSFAAVEPRQIPAASAGWNIGFDAGTAAGSVLAGAVAAAYSFPVALATMAALCILTVVLVPRLEGRPGTMRA